MNIVYLILEFDLGMYEKICFVTKDENEWQAEYERLIKTVIGEKKGESSMEFWDRWNEYKDNNLTGREYVTDYIVMKG